MKKKIFWSVLLILWMGIIFFFSNQKASTSTSLSNGMIDNIISFIEKINGNEFSQKEVENISNLLILPIRKGAHFSIYLILGILVFNLIKQYKKTIKEIIIISILICLFYSLTDEIHQLFVIGRSGEILDVLIDTLGSILGISIMYRIVRKKYNFIEN